MTSRQKEAYDYIVVCINQNGFSPSLIEIGKALGCNHSNVVYLIDRLEEQGYIERLPGHRGVKILK